MSNFLAFNEKATKDKKKGVDFEDLVVKDFIRRHPSPESMVCVLNSPRTSPFNEQHPSIFGNTRKHLFLQYNPDLGHWAVLEEHEIQALIQDQIVITRAITDHKGACNFNKVKFGIFDQMYMKNFGWQTRKSPRQNSFALNNGCYVPGFSHAVVAPWDDMVFKRINCSYLPVSERKQGFRHYMESTFGKSVTDYIIYWVALMIVGQIDKHEEVMDISQNSDLDAIWPHMLGEAFMSQMPIRRKLEKKDGEWIITPSKGVVTFDGTRDSCGYQLLRSRSITAIAEKSRYIPGYYDDFMSEVFDVANSIYSLKIKTLPAPLTMLEQSEEYRSSLLAALEEKRKQEEASV